MNFSPEYQLQALKGIAMVFNNAQMNDINKYKDNRLVDIYPTTEVFQNFTSTEGMNGGGELSDEETPPLLTANDGFSVQIEEKRFGRGISLNETELRRLKADSSLKVQKVLLDKANMLKASQTNFFVNRMFDFFNYGFVTTKYAAPDAVALFGTHSWATPGADTFSNAGTAKLTMSAIDALEEYGGNFLAPNSEDGIMVPNPLDFDIIVVKKGSENAREAKRLFAMGISPVAVADINIYEGSKTIIETPYITYANRNNWYAFASKNPMGNPLKIGIGEYPTLREPIRQNNEAVRSNCTGFWKMGITNIPFAWYGSTGAA
jgi:hypothetical protein